MNKKKAYKILSDTWDLLHTHFTSTMYAKSDEADRLKKELEKLMMMIDQDVIDVPNMED